MPGLDYSVEDTKVKYCCDSEELSLHRWHDRPFRFRTLKNQDLQTQIPGGTKEVTYINEVRYCNSMGK